MKALKNGSKGADVKKLQAQLNAALKPSPKLKADGVFGPKTEAAVKLFQKKNSAKSDGVIGPKTMKVLDAKGGKAKPDATGGENVEMEVSDYKTDGIIDMIKMKQKLGAGINDDEIKLFKDLAQKLNEMSMKAHKAPHTFSTLQSQMDAAFPAWMKAAQEVQKAQDQFKVAKKKGDVAAQKKLNEFAKKQHEQVRKLSADVSKYHKAAEKLQKDVGNDLKANMKNLAKLIQSYG